MAIRAVIPLFAAYEVGLILLRETETRNAADALLRRLFGLSGIWPLLWINAALLILLCLAVRQTRARGVPMGALFGLILIESAFWALCLAPLSLFFQDLAALATSGFKDRAFWSNIVFGLGAGAYEELLFRLIFLGGALWLCSLYPYRPTLGDHWLRWLIISLFVVLSAVLFSLSHHLGGQQTFELQLFLYRAFAGCLLGLLFLVRGFAIVVWTHALYDIHIAVKLAL